MITNSEYFTGLPVYESFLTKASAEQVALVNKHVDVCMPLLDLYYKAFPTYTLHNSKHQKNILRIVGEMLGDDLNKLTALECALIILSAVYHDLGMVFKDSELEDIAKEDSFHSFLDNNYKAKLEFNESESVLTIGLSEWYCRWMHAQRVWLHLADFDSLKWGTIALNTVLGNICESHSYQASKLNDDSKFETNFINQADVRFCALLLRLADILDFDNSRTPKSLYEFLDLDSPKNQNEFVSKGEWQKHLYSEGFGISKEGNNVELSFTAGPIHPQIEKNIHSFLDLVEDELKSSSMTLDKCSGRWREIKLPLSIDRRNIKSQNYKTGNYRLSLDETQIIKLLAGESLYDSEYVFVRELLQNAIDTSRMREFHEHSNGVLDFKVRPIEVKTWLDASGYRWVRIDDYGMGINEYVIENHLLRKGSSFYKSDFFKIQKRYFKEKTNREFTPISRFGIGLLSCFIMGDVIEINSRSKAITQTKNPEERIRISISGLQGEYFMQTEKDYHNPIEMPSEPKFEKGFRKDYGSSIAVRINRNKDYVRFEEDFLKMLKNYVTCSPVDVYYSGTKVGIDFDELLFTPFSKKQFFSFSSEQRNQIEELMQRKFIADIGIEVLPVDISAKSKNPNIKGQIVFMFLKCDDLTGGKDHSFQLSFSLFDYRDKHVRFTRKQYNPQKQIHEDVELKVSLNQIFELAFDVEYFDSIFLLKDGFNFYKNGVQIIHNGINVPNMADGFYHYVPKIDFFHDLFAFDHFVGRHEMRHGCFGVIYLQDNLMPNLSVARNAIKSLSFSIYSNLFYSTRELNNHISSKHYFYNYLDRVDWYFSVNDVKSDELVSQGVWDDEKIFETDKGLVSIKEIKEFLKGGEVKVGLVSNAGFLKVLTQGLLEINFEVVYFCSPPKDFYFVLRAPRTEQALISDNFDYFPLLFLSFNNSHILAHNEHVNINHWLGKWLFTNRGYLMREFEENFKSLIRSILDMQFTEIELILKYFRKILADPAIPNLILTKADFV
jgi:hypothetical protein